MQHLYIFAKPFLGIACLVFFLGTGAAFAQTTNAGGIGLFGDGSDGDVIIGVKTTLNRDMYYSNLTIERGLRLDTGGFRVFVSGTLKLNDGARLSRDGGCCLDETPGLSPGTLGGSGGVERVGNFANVGESVANSLGGSAYGLLAWCGGVASPPDVSAGGVGVFRSALQALSGRSLDGALVNGGAGTCLGSSIGSDRGSGGGVVVVAAHTVVVLSGLARISANGGPYAGGGVAVVITTTLQQPTGLKLSADGGVGYSYDGTPSSGYPGFTAWLN